MGGLGGDGREGRAGGGLVRGGCGGEGLHALLALAHGPEPGGPGSPQDASAVPTGNPGARAARWAVRR
ncbi:hypothetical protein CLM82_02200, partial [Streptomyces albidoflavus]